MSPSSSKLFIFDAKLIEEKEYWCERLSRRMANSNITLDYKRPETYSGEKGHVDLNIVDDVYFDLCGKAGNSNVLVYTILLAVAKVCLYKYANGSTIVVGSPALISQNEHAGHQPNALAIISEIDESQPFRQFLNQVRQTMIDAYNRQHYPFHRLVKDLGLTSTAGRCPIFDVVFSFEGIHGDLPELINDITIRVKPSVNHLEGTIEFNKTLFLRENVELFRDHFLGLLSEAMRDIDRPIRDLNMATAAEISQTTEEYNNQTDGSGSQRVHQLFMKRALETPDSIAIVSASGQFSYRELNECANQLAHYIHAVGGGAEMPIGVCLDRSPELVMAFLAALKAGCVYVPINPDLPKELLAYIVGDSLLSMILTKRRLAAALHGCGARLICLDSDRERVATESRNDLDTPTAADNLAYIIYTSGSTGKPKGVCVPHRGLCNLAEVQIREFDVSPESHVLQFAPHSFDASISEFLMSLLSGAAIYMADGGSLLSGPELIRLLKEKSITTITLPPSTLGAMEPEQLAALKTIIVAGETCSPHLLARWGQGRRFLNAYGPTESTVCATIAECEANLRTPPIGKPIPSVQVYLLDSYLRRAPKGVPSELYIGGVGVARGYCRQPELTAERFIPNLFSNVPGARLYRTGDLARYLANGEIEFLGRVDFQVKIRGYRIEPGEIEAALSQHPMVQEAVVTIGQDGLKDDCLIAYIVLKTSSPSLSVKEIRGFLSNKLPEYMMPAHFIHLEKLPHTPSGKIDRRSLPSSAESRLQLGEVYVSPRNPIEKAIAEIWVEIFNRERVGAFDNFFDLGGHSLLATQVINRVQNKFQVSLPLRSIFESPTIADLADQIVKRQLEQTDYSEMALRLAEVESLSEEEAKMILAKEA
jgi:amino acid adenylation domain-containing protein